MDKNEIKVLTDADQVLGMTESEGWKLVKAKLDTRLLDLQNINNLDLTDVATLPTQLAARKMAVDIIWDWLKQDVYGFVEQQANSIQKTVEEPENFINRE